MTSTEKGIKGNWCLPIQRDKENDEQSNVVDYKESFLLKRGREEGARETGREREKEGG